MKNINQFFDVLWKDYANLNPQAIQIKNLFESQGETVINDHVAFRTFNFKSIGLEVMAKAFKEFGYKEKGEYFFKEKKLYAKHYEHPEAGIPKIFISELLVNEFDNETQKILNKLASHVSEESTQKLHFCTSGRPWDVSHKTYQELKKVSEYAAWMSAYGFRVNHFTVSINHLKKFKTIQMVNDLLKKNNFILNDSGGEIKGTAQELLEQSSTLAYNQKIEFQDGQFTIPACYYEFALRYPMKNGELYQGFIAKSADKIFESTDRGQ